MCSLFTVYFVEFGLKFEPTIRRTDLFHQAFSASTRRTKDDNFKFAPLIPTAGIL